MPVMPKDTYGLDQLEPQFRERKKEERTDKHYLFTHLFSLFTIAIFLLLIVLARDIPDYFIGMVGAILGYYLAKKPFE